MPTLENRLDPRTYVDDPAVGVGLGPESLGDRDALWVPERLFLRLVQLGRAYELHLLPLIDSDERVFLNGTQVVTLIDELDFVASVVDDPALGAVLPGLRALLIRASQGPGATVEGQ